MSLVRIDSLSVLAMRRLVARGNVFAILDATDEPSVPARVRRMGARRALSLYCGTAHDRFWAVAPYLVQVDLATFDWITGALWSGPWGILFAASVDLNQLRTHFRRLLTVQGPDQEPVFFRFYDPRVLVSFLPTCSAEQLHETFGPVESFAWADWNNYGVVTCRRLEPEEEVADTRPTVRLRLLPQPTSRTAAEASRTRENS